MKRIIGTYEGTNNGTLVIAVGAMHGNEPAGVKAIEQLFDMLENEPKVNPTFQFRGKLVGMIGNLQAFKAKIRFVDTDLNRLFSQTTVTKIAENSTDLNAEEHEFQAFVAAVFAQIEAYKAQRLILIDLHTTSADGGIFAIPKDDDPNSVALAQALHAPVVLGLATGFGGTTLHFFTEKTVKIPVSAVAFESGQHDDPDSVSRAVAALVHALRAVGAVRARDVESRHETLLRRYSEGLPKVVKLVYVHRLEPDDVFEMLPNFKNFQPVEARQPLAYHQNEVVLSPQSGLILMPLYQKRGADGFFLVEKMA